MENRFARITAGTWKNMGCMENGNYIENSRIFVFCEPLLCARNCNMLWGTGGYTRIGEVHSMASCIAWDCTRHIAAHGLGFYTARDKLDARKEDCGL